MGVSTGLPPSRLAVIRTMTAMITAMMRMQPNMNCHLVLEFARERAAVFGRAAVSPSASGVLRTRGVPQLGHLEWIAEYLFPQCRQVI